MNSNISALQIKRSIKPIAIFSNSFREVEFRTYSKRNTSVEKLVAGIFLQKICWRSYSEQIMSRF